MSDMAGGTGVADRNEVFAGIKVVDTDTHITEWADLWTSRAPHSYKGRVPRVVEHGGRRVWMIGEGFVISPATGSSAILKDGSKIAGWAFMDRGIEEATPGAYSVKDRLAYMDEQGFAAQIGYTNLLGFGGTRALAVDEEIRTVSTRILNDAYAEMQADSGNRIYPMTLIPWWDIKLAVAEAERGADMGLRGIAMNSGPHTNGMPHLADPYWDPLWEFCADRGQPVNFHIGASEESSSWFGHGHWGNLTSDEKMAFGSTMLFAGNMTVIINMLISDMLDRHPGLKIVSVESGVGWVPFMLETIQYQLTEQAGSRLAEDVIDKFRRHFYICSWYEKDGMLTALDKVGADNMLFETDYPHPTCLYPDALGQVAATAARMTEADRRKIFQTNAEALYKLDLSNA